MNRPANSLAAVFEGVGKPLRIASFPLREPPPGHILARVRLAALCGSDLHTVAGRRSEPIPLILGHEIVAEVAALGAGVTKSSAGLPLDIADRITFSIMASCGRCPNCRRAIPQKCESLFKYGHSPCTDDPPLSGGLAEYICLRPGTAVFHVPPHLPDRVVCPANCALATALNAIETAGITPEERVWVQGAGLLGLYCTALLDDLRVAEIVVTDLDEERLKLASKFGAHHTLNVAAMSADQTVDALGRNRFDCIVEASGNPSVVRPGVSTLALKGRYVIVGLVCPGSDFTIDGNTVARNYLTLTGIHNYAPAHLARALAFLERTSSRLPYENLVGEVLPLSKVADAFALARAKRNVRVAVRP
ncbi:MAG: zinc-binding dehydrogenase [Planctomycetota bacterium]